MKLIITDHGDPSVGIFPEAWAVDCPLSKHDGTDILDLFRSDILAAYAEFAQGKLTADYDFEIEQENEFLKSIE